MALGEFTQTVGQNRYVLLDGAILDAPKLVYSYDDTPGFDQIYRNTPHQSALEVSPCIAQFSDTGRLWEEESAWRSAGVVIESDEDIEVVSDHLRSLVSVRLPDRTFAYLRFYSPGQIGALHAALTPEEFAMFSGPVCRWHYFDTDLGWKVLDVLSVDKPIDTGDEGWFQLTEVHIRAIEVHNEAAFIKKLLKNAGLSVTPASVSAMGELVKQGRTYGFRTQGQLASYTEIATYYPDRICHDAALNILTDVKRPARARLGELDNLMAHGGA